MSVPRWATGLVAWALFLSPPAFGQAGRSVVLRGRVGDAENGNPVVHAEIVLPGPDLVIRTGPDGRYSARSLPQGTYLVLVRSVGYRPWVGTLALGGADTATATFLLHPMLPIARLATYLPDLAVTGAVRASARMAPFERRRASGQGYFLGRAELARRDHSRLSDVLRLVPGTALVETGAVTQGLAISRMTLGGTGPLCFARIFLDGQKIYDPNSVTADAPPNVDAWPVRELEAIEIYRGIPETPTEYLGRGADCGTVLIWTRTPGSGTNPDR